MARERFCMQRVKELFRLKFVAGLSARQIARALGMSKGTVDNYLHRARAQQLEWDEVVALPEEELEVRLFRESSVPTLPPRPLPDFAWMHEELRRHKELTLALLWEEYKSANPDGYERSWYYEQYRFWKKRLDLPMRQEHKGGEKLFEDYCDGPSVFDPESGEGKKTQIFVAVWGASNYTYAEASFSQDLFSWTLSNARALEYFGCVPHVTVPDNLKSAVKDADFYEPTPNAIFQRMSEHYGFVILPARPRKPRDKAKVEVGVQIVQRWILAALRHRRFTSLSELNAAIRELLGKLNTRPLRKMQKSRRELFLELDKPSALPLTDKRFEHDTWKKARVHSDYHVEVDRHYYSVPYRLAHQVVEVRLTALAVEVFHRGERVAAHPRSRKRYGYTRNAEHMPPAHREQAGLTRQRLVAWAERIGPKTAELVNELFASRPHPEQAIRSALGVLRMERRVGAERLEKAADRALRHRAVTYQSVKRILAQGLDQMEEPRQMLLLPEHENIRGCQYYDEEEKDDVERADTANHAAIETIRDGAGL